MFQLCTYHNQCEGDHDSSQQLVGDGVLLEGIPDGLIVTEETPFEGGVLRGEDEKWKSDCSGNKGHCHHGRNQCDFKKLAQLTVLQFTQG